MQKIETTVDSLDDIKGSYNFNHFTVRNGKAKYVFDEPPDTGRYA